MNTDQRERNREEFEALIFEHLESLRRNALRLTRRDHDADDLVQDTVLKAYRSFHTYVRNTNFRAWVFRIQMNAYIDRYNRSKSGPKFIVFQEYDPVDPLSQKEAVHFTIDEIETLKEYAGDEIKAALEDLKEENRVVFLLSVIEGFSYKEISSILNLPPGTVMSRLYRARESMKRKLRSFVEANNFSTARKNSKPIPVKEIKKADLLHQCH